MFVQTPEQGADGVMFVAVSPTVNQDGGTFYANCKSQPVNPLALNREVQEKLYELSVKLCNESHNITALRNKSFSQGVTVDVK